MRTLRTWLFWLHLTAGVTVGLAIATMSATGAMLALQPQILERLEHRQRLVAVPPNPQRLAPSVLLDAAVGDRPWPDAVTLTMSAAPEASALVSLGRGEIRYVHPYSGVVVGEGARGARLAFQWLTEFHRWFAAPPESRAGARAVTGWSTLAFVALIVSGVVLWIPRRISRALLARRVTPAWPSTLQARHFNWHTVAGFWCAPVLTVLALSGVVLAFPWANRLLYAVAGTPQPPAAARVEPSRADRAPAEGSNADEAAAPDSRRVDSAWRRAEQQMPTWSSIAMRIQARTNGPLSFTITDTTHWNRFARSQLAIASSTGEVLRWEPYNDISRGQRWRGWARFAHTGELGGVAGQVLAGAASVGATLLVWTGLSLAIRRLGRTRDVKRSAARAA